MARHVFSALCKKGLIERDTNLVSLLEIVEKLNLHDPVEELESKKGLKAIVQYPMELVTWWVRSDYEVPETAHYRPRFLGPSGQVVFLGMARDPQGEDVVNENEGFELNLKSRPGMRHFLRMPGFPWDGFGLYWILVEGRKENENEWSEAARIPLEIVAAQPVKVARPEKKKARKKRGGQKNRP